MNPPWKIKEQVKPQMFPLGIQGRELMACSLTQAKKLQIKYFRCELCKTELHLKLSVAFGTSLQVTGIAGCEVFVFLSLKATINSK